MPSTDKALLVTGASQRLGAAMASRAASLGYDIALHYHHSKQAAEELAEQLSAKHGVQCCCLQADLADNTTASALIKDATAAFPHLNGLVNSASIFKPSRLLDEDDHEMMANMQSNALSPWQLIRELGRHWRDNADETQDRLVVNLLDQNVAHNPRGHFAYNVSKRCLAALTELAAIDLAPLARVNAIAPGFILPPPEMTDPQQQEQYRQQRAKHIPLQRTGHPDDIADALSTLLTQQFMTGQTLYVDGGEHL